MLTQLEVHEGFVAFVIEGQVTRDDIETIAQWLDTAVEKGGPVHLFAEIRDIQGMALDAWMADLSHALRYLTRLRQFGRLALVSDRPWMRVATRVESALLPFVTYEVFTPDQRDHALAWVKGEVSEPRAPGLRMIGQDQDPILAFDIAGLITKADIELMQRHLSRALGAGRPLYLLARVQHYDGFEPGILVDRAYVNLQTVVLKHVARYAIVGGPDWFDWTTRLMSPLLRMELRQFPPDEEEAARAWLLEEAGPA